jgi:hypothetical protein
MFFAGRGYWTRRGVHMIGGWLGLVGCSGLLPSHRHTGVTPPTPTPSPPPELQSTAGARTPPPPGYCPWDMLTRWVGAGGGGSKSSVGLLFGCPSGSWWGGGGRCSGLAEVARSRGGGGGGGRVFGPSSSAWPPFQAGGTNPWP